MVTRRKPTKLEEWLWTAGFGASLVALVGTYVLIVWYLLAALVGILR